jgi:hypothetical protein
MTVARIAAHVRDRVLIDDPGLVRLDAAGRTTVAIVLTTAILLWLVHGHNGGQAVVVVGAVSSWISSITVNDINLDDRRLTTALVPIPVICGLALATVAVGDRLREDVVFLVVLFVCVYVRRYGQRALSLGVAGVFGYFFGLFVAAQITQLPALAGAVLLGAASTFVIRFVIVSKHPRGSLYWVMAAVRATTSRSQIIWAPRLIPR